jgi:hypothetical protein
MREIDQQTLDTAITLGDAVCDLLGICCDSRGQVIFEIFKKLENMKSVADKTAKSDANEAQPQQQVPRLPGTP